jgi:hypothetical protein
MILNILEYLRKNTAALKKGFFLLLAALVVFDILLSRKDAHYFVDSIWAYWTLFAVVGCFVLIKFAKGVAHMFLSKDEDYYG